RVRIAVHGACGAGGRIRIDRVDAVAALRGDRDEQRRDEHERGDERDARHDEREHPLARAHEHEEAHEDTEHACHHEQLDRAHAVAARGGGGRVVHALTFVETGRGARSENAAIASCTPRMMAQAPRMPTSRMSAVTTPETVPSAVSATA